MERKFIISLGRQFGAGARSIGAILSQRLGVPVFNNELLSEAAKQTGYSPDIFKKRDEKRHLFGLSRLFSNSSYISDNYLSDSTLFQIQSEVMRDLAEKGSCIIIGRCADYVLRDMDGLLKVFITSPLDKRIGRVAERLAVDTETAAKIIRIKERNRKNFYNGYTLGNWGEASTYDLCVDSSLLGDEGTADFIIDFAKKSGIII